MPDMRVLVVGCGYVGKPLVEALAAQNHEVFGVARTAISFAANVTPLACDITRAEDVARLPAEYDWVINTVSSTRGGAEEYRSVYLQGTKNLLNHLRFDRYIFTSSTSVYAQTDGSVVTESSPAEPTSATSRILRETEQLLLSWRRPAIILRLAGIYGPERGHLFLQFLRNEARIHGEGGRLLNMIHRDDVVGAIIRALEYGQAGEIYNVADSQPVTECEFFQWLADKLHRDLPPTVRESELAARKRGATNKRVSNQKLRAKLGYALKYPSFREGYAAEIESR
jgi:nucleoside-diphosphate-sugar epimerase